MPQEDVGGFRGGGSRDPSAHGSEKEPKEFLPGPQRQQREKADALTTSVNGTQRGGNPGSCMLLPLSQRRAQSAFLTHTPTKRTSLTPEKQRAGKA